MSSDQPAAINLNSVVRRNTDIASADVDGDMVMMSIEKGDYYGANGIGTRIWEMMEQPQSVGTLCDGLMQRFEVDEATCHSEVLAFMEQLRENALLQVVDAG